MNATQRQARVAGLWYLLGSAVAPIGFMYVPGKVVVPGNATATVDRIRALESLYRLGIASELVGQVIMLFLALALYRLFKAVNEHHARLLVVLGALVPVPIVFVNVLNEVAALILVSGAEFLSAFEQAKLDALAYLFVRLHGQGITVVSIFWGLWLSPFGMLVIRSGFIPRAFGILLMVAGTAYLASASAALFLPQYASQVRQVAMPLYFAEPPIIIWLLVWGARSRRTQALAG